MSNRKRPSGEVADCTRPPTCEQQQAPTGTRAGVCTALWQATWYPTALLLQTNANYRPLQQRWHHTPRTSVFFSSTSTSRPCRASRPAVARPPAPAPITVTFWSLAAAAWMARWAHRCLWAKRGRRRDRGSCKGGLQDADDACMVDAVSMMSCDWPRPSFSGRMGRAVWRAVTSRARGEPCHSSAAALHHATAIRLLRRHCRRPQRSSRH